MNKEQVDDEFSSFLAHYSSHSLPQFYIILGKRAVQQICNIESLKRRIEGRKDPYKVLWLYEHALSGFSSNKEKNKKIKKTRVLLNKEISSLNRFEAFLYLNTLHYSKYSDLTLNKYETFDLIILQDFQDDFSNLLSDVLRQSTINSSIMFIVKEQAQIDKFCASYSHTQASEKENKIEDNEKVNSMTMFSTSLFTVPHVILTETFNVLNVNTPTIKEKEGNTKSAFKLFKKHYKNKDNPNLRIKLSLETRQFGRFLVDLIAHLLSRKRNRNSTTELVIIRNNVNKESFFDEFKVFIKLHIESVYREKEYTINFNDSQVELKNIKHNSTIILSEENFMPVSKLDSSMFKSTIFIFPNMNDFIIQDYKTHLELNSNCIINDANGIKNKDLQLFLMQNYITEIGDNQTKTQHEEVMHSFLITLNPTERVIEIENTPVKDYGDVGIITLKELNKNRKLLEKIYSVVLTNSYFNRSSIEKNFNFLVNKEDTLGIIYVKGKTNKDIDNVAFIYNSSCAVPARIFENESGMVNFDVIVYTNTQSILRKSFKIIDHLTGIHTTECSVDFMANNSTSFEKRKAILLKINDYYSKANANRCYVVQVEFKRDVIDFYMASGYVPFYLSERKNYICFLYCTTVQQQVHGNVMINLLLCFKERITEFMLETDSDSENIYDLIYFIKLVDSLTIKLGGKLNGDITNIMNKDSSCYIQVLEQGIWSDISHLEECRPLVVGYLKQYLSTTRISNFSKVRLIIIVALFFNKKKIDDIAGTLKIDKESVLDEIKSVFKLFNK